jgi:hypothetical protein
LIGVAHLAAEDENSFHQLKEKLMPGLVTDVTSKIDIWFTVCAA